MRSHNIQDGGSAMKKTTILFATFLLSCAQTVGTIDRVQQNLVRKTDILYNPDGSVREWYYRMTVVDAPYASAYSFIGDEGPLERGVFDIQEKYLYFYRIYTFTENEYNQNPRNDVDVKLKCQKKGKTYEETYCANGKPVVPNCACNGDYLLKGEPVWMDKKAPLLAFPIDAHVDVIWEYNPVTGETTNVRVENQTDRMWFEREYMRVEWGKNEMPYLANLYTALTSTVVFKDESAPPDLEPKFDLQNGYFDFVDDWVFTAPHTYYEGYGEIPVCWFYPWYSGGIYECVSEKIRVRNSFLAVNREIEDKYVPVIHDDFDQARFGYFRMERMTWDKYYGATYTGVKRYAYKFDIFERDANGNIICNDPETGKPKTKPIVYYLSEGFPEDLVLSAVAVGNAWNEAFKEAVASACSIKPEEVDDMFVVCENNLLEYNSRLAKKKGDEQAKVARISAPCVVTDEVKRMGDLRYNFLVAVTAPTENGLYGFGPMSADPLSGRIVSANAYIYVAAMKEGATRALMRLELLAGTRSFRELADALFISQKTRYDRLRDTYWRQGYTDEDVNKIVSGLVSEEVQQKLETVGVQKTDENFTQMRLGILRKSPDLEGLLIGDDIKLLFKDPRVAPKFSDLTKDQRENYALRNWAFGAGRNREFQKLIQNDGEKAIDRAGFYDGALIRLSMQYKKQFDQEVCEKLKAQQEQDDQTGASARIVYDFSVFSEQNPCTVEALIEQLRKEFALRNYTNPYAFNKTYITTPLELSTQDASLRRTQEATNAVLEALREKFTEDLYRAIFEGVALHEVGHNVGLRHNFEASTDALNFPKEYWYLKVKPKAGGGYEPVSLWGETKEQALGLTPDGTQVGAGMRELQYSSVMDYFLKFNLPWHGLGLYDKAAIKYVYAGTVETFTNDAFAGGQKEALSAYLADPSREDPSNYPALKNRGEGLGKLLYVIHPTEIPNVFGSIENMYEKRVDKKKEDVFGAKCYAEGASCGDGKVCKRFREGLRCSVPEEVVPYRFGGDELAGLLPTVDIWDEGVDPFEIVQNYKELYENYWIFRGYWYGDATYWPSYYYDFVARIFFNMRNQYQWWVLGYATYNKNGFWQKRFGKRWEEDVNGGKSGALASYVAFNTLASAFGRPDYATYGYNFNRERYEIFDQVNMYNYANQVVLLEERVGARPIYPDWNYNGYLPVVVASGSIYERIAAFQALSDPELYVAGLNTEEDTGKYLVNFGTVFRKEINELFGGLMANNATKYGWCMLEHTYRTKNKVGPVAAAPRVFGVFKGQVPSCENMFCGIVDEAHEVATSIVEAPNPFNPSDPCGEELRAKGYVALRGVPIEPEPLYIFPTTRYRVPMLAAYYGYSLLVDNYDRSFMDMTRVWLKGHEYGITLPPNAEVVECEDRFSGRIYRAYRLPGDGYYPAYDLVYQCKVMFDCYDETKNKNLTDAQLEECARLTNKQKSSIPSLTLDTLRAEYLFSDLQFLVGKLELIRAMHADYEWYGAPPSTQSGSSE